MAGYSVFQTHTTTRDQPPRSSMVTRYRRASAWAKPELLPASNNGTKDEEPKYKRKSARVRSILFCFAVVAGASIINRGWHKSNLDASEASQNDGTLSVETLIVGLTDFSYAAVSKKWYDQMTALGYTEHIVVVTDSKARDYFQSAGGDYRVEVWFDEDQQRSWKNSDKLFFAREKVAHGKSLMLMDVDVHVSKRLSLARLQESEFDIYHSYGTVFPLDIFQKQGFVVCGCLTFYTANSRTLRFLDQVLDAREENERSDQAAINRAYADESMKMQWKEDARSQGREGFSGATGLRVKIWDSNFAWRGRLGSKEDCPSPEKNFVAMPVAGKGASAKLNALQQFSKMCTSPIPVSREAGGFLQNENAMCSCTSPSCVSCSRRIIVVHKMGSTLVRQMIRNNFPDISVPDLDHNKQAQFFLSGFDYREVIFARNWYDALISGYLYHKSGRECWLNPYGGNFTGGWLMYEDWERSISSNIRLLAWPSGRGRNLCQYLADESESNGMRVYIEFAMVRWLQPLRTIIDSRMQDVEQTGFNRTLVVCYEQLVSPDLYNSNVRAIGNWLYPDRLSADRMKVTQPESNGSGGHATDHSPELRKNLYQIVEKIDRLMYNGDITSGSAQFGCRGEIEKPTMLVK